MAVLGSPNYRVGLIVAKAQPFHNGHLKIIADALMVCDEIISRSVIGNEKYGYKMAFCQRDLAMYTSLLLFGSLYLLTGKKIQRIPFLLWLTLGILPLGIDGFIQLIGNKWESTPYLRTITGMMFGLFSGWFLFPSLESINKE